jgi:hypothetical protein
MVWCGQDQCIFTHHVRIHNFMWSTFAASPCTHTSFSPGSGSQAASRPPKEPCMHHRTWIHWSIYVAIAIKMVMVHMTTRRCNSAHITMHEPAGFALHLHGTMVDLVVEAKVPVYTYQSIYTCPCQASARHDSECGQLMATTTTSHETCKARRRTSTSASHATS